MTIKQLSGYVGSNVEITFYDGKTKKGVLGYSKEFSAKYGYRKVGYFYIDNLCLLDLINRPYIAFIHPDVLEALKETNPEIEKKIVLQPTPWIAKDKCYLMKRIDLEIKL